MNVRRPILMPVMLCTLLAFTGSLEELSFATPKKASDQDPSRASPRAHRISPEASQRATTSKATKEVQPVSAETKTGSLRQPRPTAEKPSSKKNHRTMKAHIRPMPKAVVQPRTDLIPYGMLEDSQRYDPLPRAASSGVPSPQRHDLIQDHFQELDRNQDGKIDPIERAFGRIDLDRDLHSRTLQ